MDYPHFSVNFVNFGIHKLSTLIKMGLHSCVKKKPHTHNTREQRRERWGARVRGQAGGCAQGPVGGRGVGTADWMPSVASGHPLLPSALPASPLPPGWQLPPQGASWNLGWGCLVPGLNQRAKSHAGRPQILPGTHSNPRLNLLPGAAFLIYPETNAGSLRAGLRDVLLLPDPHGPLEAIVRVSLSQFSHYWE